jgi:hypothetical protein
VTVNRRSWISRLAISGAVLLAALIASETLAEVTGSGRLQSMAVDRSQPIPVNIPSADKNLSHGPEMTSSFISKNAKSVLCADYDSTIAMLERVGPNGPKLHEIKTNRCLSSQKHMRITGLRLFRRIEQPDGGETEYLGFSGEDWTPGKNLAKIYGVINVTANLEVEFTDFEKWQHVYTPFDGKLRRSNSGNGTKACLKPETAVKLIEGRRAAASKSPDQRQIQRLELLNERCKPASGVFQPLALLERWEHNGSVFSALKAEDEKGQIVGILHVDVAPRPSF